MPLSTSSDRQQADLIGDPRLSAALAAIAGAVVLLAPLINSPGQFSQRHLEDQSLLRPLVSALGLWGGFPTVRGIEVRNLIYYAGAVMLSGLAGAYLIYTRARPRHSLDDLMDIRERAKNPYFWWMLLLLVSVLSSWYAHAPRTCLGQTTIRFMHFAWWFPLAMFLQPAHVRMLCATLLIGLIACGGVGLWYQAERAEDFLRTRLAYPLGNELWMAACMLPAVFAGLGFAGRRWTRLLPGVTAGAIGLLAIGLTRSRSALAGLIAGVFAYVYFLTPRRYRAVVLLGALASGIIGAVLAQQLRVGGVMGQRAHSIRSRLNHEWPYALKLFADKPVAGNGDGAYSMLAGQYAREDQLEDPAVLRFDESVWTEHAHNEFLELLADLGAAGMIAFAAALGVTLLYAARYCERLRVEGTASPDRPLAAGLGAALTALVIDQCTETSLREPGLPAIFFTVWALLWALVRRERLVKFEQQENRRLPNYLLRILGGVVLAGAGYLGLQALLDWRAARSMFIAKVALQSEQYDAAKVYADEAGRRLLDPFQRNQARLYAIGARSLAFDQMLARVEGPLADEQMETARVALANLGELKAIAPRFLKVSRLEAELSLNVARAFERRREAGSALEFQRRFLAALEQSRADEPFLFERLFALWQVTPQATAIDRLNWLRALVRGGELDPRAVPLLQQLMERPDFAGAINDLINIALQDAKKPVPQWRDMLSPETLRLAAMFESLRDRAQSAARFAEAAEGMYEAAGPRLFAAHAAVLHEWVVYDLAAAGAANTQQNLERLARAWRISKGPAGAGDPLPGESGRLRLKVLETGERREEAELQRRMLDE